MFFSNMPRMNSNSVSISGAIRELSSTTLRIQSTQVSRDFTVCSFPESRFERRDVILQILKSIPESSQVQSLMKLTVGYFP
jgi:hypothetical protein